jgi:hypothetical protein
VSFSGELKTMAVDMQDHVSMLLKRLDLLLHREILRLLASYQLSLDEFRGLYITNEQVNQLINRDLNYEGASSVVDELTKQAESLRVADSNQRSGKSIWQRLVNEFCLSPIEKDVLLLAVDAEIDLNLSRNFLEFPGSIEEEPARHIVRVGRPSLHLVLNMPGMTRGTYALSWLDGRPLAIFQES